MSYWDIVGRATGQWPLQDNESTQVVAPVAGAVGTLVGGATTAQRSVAGPNGWLPKALRFDGAADHVETPAQVVSLSEGTVAAWVRPASLQTTYTGVVARRGQFTLHTHVNGRLHYNWADAASQYGYGGPPYAVGQWQHVVLRVRPDRVDFFVDGVLGGGKAESHGPVTQTEPLMIAYDSLDPSRHFDGDLAGVQVYDEALDDAAIVELYSGPEPTASVGPALSAPVAVGSELVLSPGVWDSHGNGSASVTWRLQRSVDGASGWQDVAGSLDQSQWLVLASDVGSYLRIAASASNLGGASDEMFSAAQVVLPASRPAIAEAGQVRVAGATAGSVKSVAGAAAGLVLPREANVAA